MHGLRLDGNESAVEFIQQGNVPNEFMNLRHLQYPSFKPEPVEQLHSLCR